MMLRRFVFFVNVLFISLVTAQTKDPLEVYRKENDRSTVLEHTKLKVSFNFKDKELYGEAWLTLHPYFYKSSTLVLDAKAMLIHNVQLKEVPLQYKYNGLHALAYIFVKTPIVSIIKTSKSASTFPSFSENKTVFLTIDFLNSSILVAFILCGAMINFSSLASHFLFQQWYIRYLLTCISP